MGVSKFILRYYMISDNILIIISVRFSMSYYRQSPSRRSPYHPSPIKVLPSDRGIIEEQMHLKSALRAESENRRLFDEISQLQIKLRKTEELQTKVDTLLKQNALLAQENDTLSRQISERRYEADRLRANSVQLQQRDAIKVGQLSEINQSLQLQINLLKKEKMQGCKLYEDHILKLQHMLQQKIKELDHMNIRFNDVMNEKEILIINFQEQKNKLKNLINRLSHEKDREIQDTRDKNQVQKSYEIDTLKKNYTSQVMLLDDEINKLKGANNYRNNQFEAQLAENKAIRLRHDQQIRALTSENDSLRERMLKLQELNRSQVQNIQGKYSDIHYKGTTDLKQHHGRQAKILLDEIEKLQWLLTQKNNQIQNLIKQKREHRNTAEERDLANNSEIDTLKNKIHLQQQKNAENSHQLINKNNILNDKLLRESQYYHQRVVVFRDKINQLQAEIAYKQNCIQNVKAENQIKSKEHERTISELTNILYKTKIQLKDEKDVRQSQNQNHEQYQQNSQNKIKELTKKINQLEVINETLNEKLVRSSESSSNNEELLRIEISTLKNTINILQGQLTEEGEKHNLQLQELSRKLRNRIEQLIKTQKQTIQELQMSKDGQIVALMRRIQKLQRQKSEMCNKLREYVSMYQVLQKYFAQPHEGALFQQKGDNNIYEVLVKTIKSTIEIF